MFVCSTACTVVLSAFARFEVFGERSAWAVRVSLVCILGSFVGIAPVDLTFLDYSKVRHLFVKLIPILHAFPNTGGVLLRRHRLK